MNTLRIVVLALAMLLGACSYPIKFEQLDYAVPAVDEDRDAVAVIPAETLRHEVVIRSFMTGIANEWQAQAGEMLRQIAEIELPQMLGEVRFTSDQTGPATPEAGQPQPLTIVLSLKDYQFDEFRASTAVQVRVYAGDSAPVLDRVYSGVGESQGEKMFWAGAFGMKSAVRQSSLDAFQTVFRQFRSDLTALLPRLEPTPMARRPDAASG